MKKRAGGPPLGVYQDYRAVFAPAGAARAELLKAARDADVRVVFSDSASGPQSDVLFLPRPQEPLLSIDHRTEFDEADRKRLHHELKDHPDEAFGAAPDDPSSALAAWDRKTAAGTMTAVASADAGADDKVPYRVVFRNTSTHILAREFTPMAIQNSLAQGHAYMAHDWLCDPTGFTFIADNFLGVFDMGDTVGGGPIAGETHLNVYVPIPARLKLIRNGAVVDEVTGSTLTYTAKEQGVYRLEAWLSIGGEERPWILSNPIYLRGVANVSIPSTESAPDVESVTDITYTSGDPADAAKHKLDLFIPKGKQKFPVLMFVHGGSWRMGDRSMYRELGVHLAQHGIGVVIPSYRLMPRNPHPAQIEDVAAAFAWMYHNIGSRGGDVQRLYVAGHSAGGHLVSLLALDPAYLSKYSVPLSAIHGVITMSGVYDVRNSADFLDAGDKAKASPITYAVSSGVPPFLIAYCQWDYLGLPKQARDFATALKKAFASVQVLYIPGESHISEIISAVHDQSALSKALASFIR